MDFYCCHGSLVQAHNRYPQYIYYQDAAQNLTISQYVPSTLTWNRNGKTVKVEQDFEGNQWNKSWDADRFRIHIKVKAEEQTPFDITVRLPWWIDKKAQVTIDGQAVSVSQLHGYLTMSREWKENEIIVDFPDRLWTEKLPGSDCMYAFMEGPIVLASEGGETSIKGDAAKPYSFLSREIDQQYRTVRWTQSHYRTTGQETLTRLKPLYEIGDESYTIYFPVKK